MYHYTYKIINEVPGTTKKFYIGVRSSKVIPKNDIYMGSSKPLLEDISIYGLDNFSKEILFEYPTRELANIGESTLLEHFSAANSDEWYNQNNGKNEKYHTVGTVTVRRNGEKSYFQIPVETYQQNKHLYKTSRSDFVLVKSDDNSTFTVNRDEFATGEYTHFSSKTHTVIRESGNKKRIPFNEKLETDIIYWNKTVPARDTITGKNVNINIDDFDGIRFVNTKLGMISVKCNESHKIITISCDEYYKNIDNYTLLIIDKVVTCFDSNNNKISISSAEYQKNKSTYKHIHEKTIAVLDLEENKIVRISTDLYKNNKSRYKIPANLGIIRIFDKDGNKMFETIGNFIEFCKKENLPMQALQASYLKNGEPIYSKSTENKSFLKNGREKFIGWYAIKEKYNGENI